MKHGRIHARLLGLGIALALAACSSEPTGPRPVPIEETHFAPSLGIDLAAMTRLETGVYIQDRVVGEGVAAEEGDSLWVHYQLWLPDGTLIQNSKEINKDEPVPLVLVGPPRGVIAGWVDGIPGMRVGGTRLLVVPSERGYGSTAMRDGRGNVIIPAYSNLVFEVELVDVRRPGAE